MANDTDDLEDLRATVEREKALEPMRATFVKRNLSFGGNLGDIDRDFEARLRERYDNLADLIQTDVWKDVIRIAMDVVLPAYKAPPSTSIDGRVAYETFCIARDVLDQLFNEVIKQAAHGTPEKSTVTEEVIDVK